MQLAMIWDLLQDLSRAKKEFLASVLREALEVMLMLMPPELSQSSEPFSAPTCSAAKSALE